MKKILILFLVASLSFAWTSSFAADPPKDANSVNKELKKGEQRESNPIVTLPGYEQNVNGDIFQVCYAQECFSHCGTFQYDACFESVPTMEQLLAYVDAMDWFINFTCT